MAAAATDKFQYVAIATATTLDAPGYTIGDTSLTVASTANMPTATGITVAIDVVDSDGVQIPGSYNEYVGVVTSGTAITSLSHQNGTDRNYSAGATTRVYLPVSEERENRLVDGILVDHSQAGAHEIATNYDPSNPTLETQKWAGVASAVNEITVTNAATGNSPLISATGGDTNVGLEFAPKGTGNIVFTHLYDWQKGSSTWTYASSTTFTVPQSDADLMSVGTKIWITQTTSKYFYVTGKSGTTITVNGGSDYTVANAAITAPYFSNAETPVGFPGTFNWTPTLTNLSGGTLNAAIFSMVGKNVNFLFRYTLAGAGVSGSVDITLPVATSSSYTASVEYIGLCNYRDTGSNAFLGTARLENTTKIKFIAWGTAGGYANTGDLSSTAPHTWANTDVITASGTYIAA